MITKRQEQIDTAAIEKYPRRWSGDVENGNNQDAFVEGAEWADSHPSEEQINEAIE